MKCSSWDWLSKQPGGASVALRRLVENALRSNVETDRRRAAREAAYRFMTAMGGNEAISAWPIDIRDHAKRLAVRSFNPGSS